MVDRRALGSGRRARRRGRGLVRRGCAPSSTSPTSTSAPSTSPPPPRRWRRWRAAARPGRRGRLRRPHAARQAGAVPRRARLRRPPAGAGRLRARQPRRAALAGLGADAWRRSAPGAGTSRRELERHFEDAELAIVAVTTAFAWTTKHGRLCGRDSSQSSTAGWPRRRPARRASWSPTIRWSPPPELGAEPVAAHAARGARPARRPHGVELVLSGHLHHGFVLPAPRRRRRRPSSTAAPRSSSRGRGGEADAATPQLDRDRRRRDRRLAPSLRAGRAASSSRSSARRLPRPGEAGPPAR